MIISIVDSLNKPPPSIFFMSDSQSKFHPLFLTFPRLRIGSNWLQKFSQSSSQNSDKDNDVDSVNMDWSVHI